MKKQAKKALENAATVDSPEQQLALAVILLAVDDVGRIPEKSRMFERWDSTEDILQGGLDVWLQMVNISKGYFILLLKQGGIWTSK